MKLRVAACEKSKLISYLDRCVEIGKFKINFLFNQQYENAHHKVCRDSQNKSADNNNHIQLFIK